MSPEEQKNTLLVINLESLIVGEKLIFSSSPSMPAAIRKLSRDKAIALAHQFAIPAAIQSDILSSKESDLYQEVALFDDVGIPVLSVVSARHKVSKKHPQQQRAISKAFPEGTVRHQAARDNMQYLDKGLPGKIKQRSRDSVRIMLPLVKSLAKAEK
jgi:alkaline phosphatase isozyme conversion protein